MISLRRGFCGVNIQIFCSYIRQSKVCLGINFIFRQCERIRGNKVKHLTRFHEQARGEVDEKVFEVVTVLVFWTRKWVHDFLHLLLDLWRKVYLTGLECGDFTLVTGDSDFVSEGDPSKVFLFVRVSDGGSNVTSGVYTG